jgi:small subunit ribosomal protein S3
MPVKKHFINRGLQEMLISEYLDGILDNSGFVGIDMQKTPLGTRITIKTSRPGLVIGRRGSKVKDLTDEVKNRFNINVPTIDVETVKNPDLNAKIMAERISFAIEKGQNYRRATYSLLRKIIRAGARGVEVTISGKVSSQRARTQVFRTGIISKCGEPAIEGVDRGVAHCILKSGVLGIRVKIMPDSYQLPDQVIINDEAYMKKKLAQPVIPEIDEEDEIEIEELEREATEDEEGLFDEVTDAKESVVKTDAETLEAEKIIDSLESKAPETTDTTPSEEDKKAKKTKKTAAKKSSGKKKTTKKAEDGEAEGESTE